MASPLDARINIIHKNKYLSSGYAILLLPIMMMTEITWSAKAVWMALSNRAREGGGGRIYPSQRTIAKDTGLSLRTVQRAIQELMLVRPADQGARTRRVRAHKKADGRKETNPYALLEVINHKDETGNYLNSDYILGDAGWVIDKYMVRDGTKTNETAGDSTARGYSQNDDRGIVNLTIGCSQNDDRGIVKMAYKETTTRRRNKKKNKNPPAGKECPTEVLVGDAPVVANDSLTDLNNFLAITQLPGDQQQHLNAFAITARSMCAEHNVTDDSVIASVMESCLKDLANWQRKGKDKPRDLPACFRSTLAKNIEGYLSAVPSALIDTADDDDEEFEWP